MGQGEKESGAMEARAKKCYFLEWGLAPGSISANPDFMLVKPRSSRFVRAAVFLAQKWCGR